MEAAVDRISAGRPWLVCLGETGNKSSCCTGGADWHRVASPHLSQTCSGSEQRIEPLAVAAGTADYVSTVLPSDRAP